SAFATNGQRHISLTLGGLELSSVEGGFMRLIGWFVSGWFVAACGGGAAPVIDGGATTIDGPGAIDGGADATTNGCRRAAPTAPPRLSSLVPVTPATTGQTMGLGPVGIAVNGVASFDDQAAPGDDIFQEALSFDQCQGHPAPGGTYHYHSEPYAISYDDAAL